MELEGGCRYSLLQRLLAGFAESVLSGLGGWDESTTHGRASSSPHSRCNC